MDAILWIVKSPFICVGWLIVGFLAGTFARRIMGSSNKSAISDMLLGFLGAIVGGWIVGMVTDVPGGGLSGAIASLIVATIGACVLIAIRNALFGTRKAKA